MQPAFGERIRGNKRGEDIVGQICRPLLMPSAKSKPHEEHRMPM